MSGKSFPKKYEDPEFFLNTPWIRETADVGEFDLVDLTEQELCEAVISDILAVTIWEFEFAGFLKFDRDMLLKFVNEQNHKKVFKALKTPSVLDLITEEKGELRIARNKLQEAMNYCQVWYVGYAVPEGVLTFRLADMPDPNLDFIAPSQNRILH